MPTMRSVMNAFQILDEVAVRQPVGVGELSAELGVPKSSVQRALTTLHHAGWIRPAEGGLTRWIMTTKVLELSRYVPHTDLRGTARPIMERLRAETNETAHLMVPEGGRVVLIERLETPNPVRIILELGISLPMHASANGKAVLAHCPPDFIDHVLSTEVMSYTDSTITDRKLLESELATVRRRGFAVNSGEWRADVACVAAAVLSSSGKPIASLSISAPFGRMPRERQSRYGRLVRAAADELARDLV